MKRHVFIFIAATCVLAVPATRTSALDFDFAKIADTSTPIPAGSGNFTGLSYFAFDGGQVAFLGIGSGQQGIYSAEGGSLCRVADLNTPIPSGSGNFTSLQVGDAVNVSSVAFVGSGLGQQGIYVDTNGALSRAFDTNTPVPSGSGNFSLFGRPSLDGGSLAFKGVGGGLDGIYTNASGPLTRVADTNTPVPASSGNFGYFDSAVSLKDGSVAFRAYSQYLGDDQYAQEGIYTNVGGSLSRLADRNTPIPSGSESFYYFNSPSLNNGSAAFSAGGWFQGPRSGVYWNVGGPLSLVADRNTPIPSGSGNFQTFYDPSLESGSLAFSATGFGGQRGIYTNLGGSLSKVIDNSTLLDGRSVLSFAGSELSDQNIAFPVTFADFSEAIYVAEQTYTYTANASGAWDTASNWSFGLKPRAVVGTVIRPEYGAVITGPASATTLRALNLGAVYGGVAELRLAPGGQLTINEWLVVETLGRLNLNGDVATAVYGFDNFGEIDLAGGQINGGGSYNSGTLRGSGTVGNYLQNFGRIQAIDSQMRFNAEVINFETARIDARNALLEFNGGLRNFGRVNFSFGTSDVFGHFQNELGAGGPGGQIIVSGNSNITFYDDLIHSGAEFRVSAASTAVFFGQVAASAPFTGDGTKMFEGGLVPEGGAGAVLMEGQVVLGEWNTLAIDLGGTAAGQFDKLDVAGKLTLGGTLDLDLVGGFTPLAGNTFDILDWTNRIGTFDAILLPDLSGSLNWDTSQFYASGVLSVVAPGLPGDFNGDGVVDAADYVVWRDGLGTTYTQADYDVWRAHFGQTAGSGAGAIAAVPEPAALALLMAGLFSLGAFGSRRLVRLAAVVMGLTLLAPSVVGAPVYDDVWDISQGATGFGGSFGWPENIFGAFVGGPEPGNSIGMDGPAGTVATAVWQTPNPVLISGFVLNLASDAPSGLRQTSHFTLKFGATLEERSQPEATVFSEDIAPYVGPLELTRTLAQPAAGQFFQAEFTRVSSLFNGPRVIELDAVTIATLVSDYNQNGVVDAADYVVWRDNLGTGNVLPNDPIGGTIGQAQYDQWRANFGQTAPGSGATAGSADMSAAVPEPGLFVLVMLGGFILSVYRRHVDSNS